MSKKTKIWLIVASSLVVLGLMMFTAVMMVYNWDFAKLSTEKYETNEYEISTDFFNISIDTDTADIVFCQAEDGDCKVVCYEPENAKHSVTVQDGTLTINEVDERKWHDYIGIHFDSPKITVHVPQNVYGALCVKSSTGDVEIPKGFNFESVDIAVSTGDIRVENVFAGMLDLSVTTGEVTVTDVVCEGDVKINVSTGKVAMTDIQCKNVMTNGSTGDISLKNVIAKEKFSIERSTGDVKFDGCDASEIFVQTDTGNVTGSLLSEKVFIIETSTGNVSVPNSKTGGKCMITTSTGDIEIIEPGR